jgi:glycosyltransferase involved in cell wall biosynthesis
VANSRMTQARIRAYFGREAEVVYPPVDTGRFSPGVVDDHYLIVSELMTHKQIDVAVETFNRLRLPLIVVGDGPDQRRLRQLAGPTVNFAGRVADQTVVQLLQSARALIVTSIEEFGIVAVEAQAAGRPVIARRGGGALESVIEGVTGTFWSGGPHELAKTILNFDDTAINPEDCVRSAKRFDTAVFRRGMFAEVSEARAAAPRRIATKRRPLASTRLVKLADRHASR